MSAPKIGDPNDPAIGADTFNGAHRAGYAPDKLQRIRDWLTRHPSATLASGEGAALLAEIVRLEDECARLRAERAAYGVEVVA